MSKIRLKSQVKIPQGRGKSKPAEGFAPIYKGIHRKQFILMVKKISDVGSAKEIHNFVKRPIYGSKKHIQTCRGKNHKREICGRVSICT